MQPSLASFRHLYNGGIYSLHLSVELENWKKKILVKHSAQCLTPIKYLIQLLSYSIQ